ncbi:glycosyltransferase family 39 protein [Microbacterium sp. zg-Y818]|uniref:ArnT family glycosyltransferase n=1 Tax=unclassified Microbacterium TaxID=2609290 RepID=UPI00214AA622|nr:MULTISPECIES: glycosyltransferase family 39 protein [unclassified Microbacterium]MCR2801718.1 glycosyltransferase family 39 protein [Microbacterium sp. zg.Y818]WIM23015.1 glycosyltransferase family 39 protein [Microbacterium sp. zg-Y818]
MTGITWGLPVPLHADEWVVVEGAIDMAARNSFEPPYFMRPDHLEMQLSYLLFQAWSHLVLGVSPEVAFASDVAPFYALARAVTAVLGTAMVPVAYLIGREYARSVGVLMALAVAVFPPFVAHSRVATPDIPLTFAVMIAILGAVRYIRTQSWRDLALGTFGVAVGVTAKYPAALAAVVIVYAVIYAALRSRRPALIVTRGLGTLGMFLGMTFLLSPTLFTNIAEVRRQLFQQNSTGHLGADGLDWGGNLAFYARDFFSEGGVLLTVFAVAGLCAILWRRVWSALPLLVGIAFWVAISALTLHWARWGLPMYITPVLLAGIGVVAVYRAAAALGRRAENAPPAARRAPAVTVAVLAAISGASLLLSSTVGLLVALAPDTRALAERYLKTHGITADQVISDGYTPFLPAGARSVLSDLTVDDGVLRSRHEGEDRTYVLTSSTMAGRHLRAAGTEGATVYSAIAEELPVLEQWQPVTGSPSSPWEATDIARELAKLAQILDGGASGPQLVLYRFPAP